MKRTLSSPPSNLTEIDAALKSILESPIQTSDGKIFKFSMLDELAMTSAIAGLEAHGGTVTWYLFTNHPIVLDSGDLQGYYTELVAKRATRNLVALREYAAYRTGTPPTQRTVSGWVHGYGNGFIPTP